MDVDPHFWHRYPELTEQVIEAVGAALEAARSEEEYWKRACAGQADIAREQHAKADALLEQVAALEGKLRAVEYEKRGLIEHADALVEAVKAERARVAQLEPIIADAIEMFEEGHSVPTAKTLAEWR